MGIGLLVSTTSNSISVSSNSPPRSFFRNISLVVSRASLPAIASITRSSEDRTAFARTSSRICERVIAIAPSTRSRIICSTSRPTYPTSVYLVASTFINGALASFAKRRLISVLPTPVGPIIKMFLGNTSSRRLSSSCFLRQRDLKATATARLASF